MSTLDIRNAMLVGSAETIIQKLVHQFETYNHDRHFFQIDLGGMKFEDVKRIIKTLGEVIIPEVNKRLGAK